MDMHNIGQMGSHKQQQQIFTLNERKHFSNYMEHIIWVIQFGISSKTECHCTLFASVLYCGPFHQIHPLQIELKCLFTEITTSISTKWTEWNQRTVVKIHTLQRWWISDVRFENGMQLIYWIDLKHKMGCSCVKVVFCQDMLKFGSYEENRKLLFSQ